MTETVPAPTPPDLSRQNRLEGARKSLELRRMRSALKDGLRRGFFSLWAVWYQPEAQGMKVYTLLTALPYIGPKKADALLIAAGVSQGKGDLERADRRKTVRAAGPKQREKLFALLAK